MTEDQLQDKIVELAHTLGWRAAHFRPARTAHGWRTACQYDAEGYPDLHLTFVQPNRAPTELYWECKTWANRNNVSPKQELWLADLRALGHHAQVATERDWDDLIVPRLLAPTHARVG